MRELLETAGGIGSQGNQSDLRPEFESASLAGANPSRAFPPRVGSADHGSFHHRARPRKTLAEVWQGFVSQTFDRDLLLFQSVV